VTTASWRPRRAMPSGVRHSPIKVGYERSTQILALTFAPLATSSLTTSRRPLALAWISPIVRLDHRVVAGALRFEAEPAPRGPHERMEPVAGADGAGRELHDPRQPPG
jgi:hypothetical protein